MKVEDAVDLLWRSMQRGIHDPEELRGQLSIDEAYRVQMGVLARYEEAGDRLVGWKVGLTAKAIQEQVGYYEPVFGFLIQSAHRSTESVFEFDSLIAPGIENELCLTIDRTLTGPDVSFEQAKEAISIIAPALEIIEKRSRPPMDIALVMADNGQQKAFVVGDGVPLEDIDLATVMVEVTINGMVQEQASGVEVMGTPIASVHWLANKLSQFGRELEAGSLVMSGSFTRQYDISKGDSVAAA